MKPTPRTDAFASQPRSLECDCHEAIDFARTLETELADAVRERDEAKLVAQKLFDVLEKLSPNHAVAKELGGLYDYLNELKQLRKVADELAELIKLVDHEGVELIRHSFPIESGNLHGFCFKALTAYNNLPHRLNLAKS
jgi:hypothetical protein